MSDLIAHEVSKAIGIELMAASASPVAGGSIHQAWRYRTRDGSVFLKIGPLSAASMLETEAAGLRTLAAARAIRVPAVLASGTSGDRAFLCLEWLELISPTRAVEARLGEQLAAMHHVLAAEHGSMPDNFIGRTPQQNRGDPIWPRFFREQRLAPQLELARANHADRHTLDRGHALMDELEAFFAEYRPLPSLLHGDLWGGNWGATREDEAVIFDPAVYYGDRETDIAMTRLFGGFSASFYQAYQAAWPLDSGANQRVTLYNLYHVLNHFNLFGGGYLAKARSMIDQLLAELGH